MKARLAKICPLLPFAIYGVPIIMLISPFLVPSCVNAVIGIPWGFLMFHYILSSDWWRFINTPPAL